jgi:hypothetical protein
VTLTLPEHVIEALAGIDPDLSRAVVRLAQPELAKAPHASAELAAFGRQAVILVHPSRTLEQRTGVVLIPLPDGRALISFDEPKTIAELELQLQDILEDSQLLDSDRQTLEQISAFLREARRSSAVTLKRRNIIVLENAHKARTRASAGPIRKKRNRKGSA